MPVMRRRSGYNGGTYFKFVKKVTGRRPRRKCRHFSYSRKECGSDNISLHFVEVSNVDNSDRNCNANQSYLVYKNV